MNKIAKRAISILLSLSLMLTLGVVSFAEEEEGSSVEFSILSANVAGLPIPSIFEENGNVVPNTQRILGQMLNESGIDVICVQEDFQFHSILAKQMKNYPYQTYTDGGVPVGSGVNVFSKYPIYNVERYSWVAFNGILDAGNDGLTPKGLVKCTVDKDGVLVDVYGLHIDAYGSYEDGLAKKAQLIELLDFIDKHSAGRPIVITGDWNLTLHTDFVSEFYPIMIEGAGYKDAWAEYCNDGVYFTGPLTQEETDYYNNLYGGYYWGRWDSVERMVYLDGDGAKLNVTDYHYENYNELAGYDYEGLTDHSMAICKYSIDTTDYTRPGIELKEEEKPTVSYRIFHSVSMFMRALNLLVGALLGLLVK